MIADFDLHVSYEQFRSLVVEALRDILASGGTGGEISNLRRSVPAVAKRMGLFPDSPPPSVNAYDRQPIQQQGWSDQSLSDFDYGRVLDVTWDLLIEGVIRPGLGTGQNRELPFFHITGWGKQAIEQGPQTPYDPDGYLKRLAQDLPALDPVIIAYLNESLHTFRIGCLLSSTISLGCASEKALLLLIDAYSNSLQLATEQDKFRKATAGKMIKPQFEEMRKAVESDIRTRLPREIKEGLDVELNAIFDFIRQQRNSAGHPTGQQVERERAYANLVVFPTYLRKVYALIGWLATHPKP